MRIALALTIAVLLAACGEAATERPPSPSPSDPAASPADAGPRAASVPTPPEQAAPAAEAADALAGFGGRLGLERLVDRFYTELLGDPVTAEYFEVAEAEPLKVKLVDQFCELLGGPCTYTGRSMRGSHWGMRLEMRHFDATLAALERAMAAESVAPEAQDVLLAKLAPMYTDIVEFRGVNERPAIERRLKAQTTP